MSDADEQPTPERPPPGWSDAAKSGMSALALGALMCCCLWLLPEGRYTIGDLESWVHGRAFSGILGAVVVGLGLYAARRGRGPVVAIGIVSIIVGGFFIIRAARVLFLIANWR
jgi:hypothetical protein